jgi:hypothetical protein
MAAGSIVIDLLMKTGSFETDTKRAEKRLADMKNTAIKAGQAIGVAFAAGGAAVAFFAQRINAPLLAMKDLSEATGASIENISALENVARIAGVSIQTTGDSLIRLNQGLSQATGTDRISEALRRIGLDAQVLKQQDPAQALRTVALALSQFADDGEKARVTQEIFGRSVRDVVPLLKELADQQQFAATVTAEQVEEADRLNKQIDLLKKNAEDAARAVAARLVPAINDIAAAAREGGGVSALVALNEQIAKFLGLDPGSELERRIKSTQEQIGKLRSGLLGIDPGPLFDSTIVEIDKLEKRLEFLIGVQNKAAEQRRPSEAPPQLPTVAPAAELRAVRSGNLPPAPTSTGLRGPEIDRLRASVNELLSQTTSARLQALRDQLAEAVSLRVSTGDERYDEVLRSIRDQLVALDPDAQAATARLERINAALAATPAGQTRAATEAVELLFDELQTATDPQRVLELNQALEQLYERLGILPAAAEQVGESMSVFAEQASRNIQDALGSTLERVLSGNFKNIGDLWKQTLQRMIAQASAARLNEFIFSALGGGSGTGPMAAFARVFQPRANGGPVTAGQTYLVGERGPELFTPATSGRVLNNSQTQQAMGGATYAPTVNVMGDVGPATVSLVERAIARERARWQRMQYSGGMT